MGKAPPRLRGIPASVAHSDESRMNLATLLADNSLDLRDAESWRGQRDVLSGGDGDDLLAARQRPAARDVIECGGGFDRAPKYLEEDEFPAVRHAKGEGQSTAL